MAGNLLAVQNQIQVSLQSQFCFVDCLSYRWGNAETLRRPYKAQIAATRMQASARGTMYTLQLHSFHQTDSACNHSNAKATAATCSHTSAGPCMIACTASKSTLAKLPNVGLVPHWHRKPARPHHALASRQGGSARPEAGTFHAVLRPPRCQRQVETEQANPKGWPQRDGGRGHLMALLSAKVH